MSLEQALAENTAAVNALNETLQAAAAKAGGGKAATKSAPAKKAPAKKTGGKKKTSVDDVKNAFGTYLGVKDKEERAERIANVKTILEYFGAESATTMDEAHFDEALGYLAQYEAGETPEFDGGEEDGDDGEALV